MNAGIAASSRAKDSTAGVDNGRGVDSNTTLPNASTHVFISKASSFSQPSSGVSFPKIWQFIPPTQRMYKPLMASFPLIDKEVSFLQNRVTKVVRDAVYSFNADRSANVRREHAAIRSIKRLDSVSICPSDKTHRLVALDCDH